MKTILNDKHIKLGAKMISFADWEMPLQYAGVIKEHKAVRERVGLFDVSHMGVIEVTGVDAGKLLDSLSTNQILGKDNNSATYTVWPLEKGGSVDDLIVYKEDEEHYFIVVNASNRSKSLDHLKKYAEKFNVHIQDRFNDMGILALQGPKSLDLIVKLFPEAKNLKKMYFVTLQYEGQKLVLSRTGYTGELGFEIYAPNESILKIFEWLLENGKSFGLELVGLGARDTLRLEMGFSLYGHELNESISANESLSSWTIRGENRAFLGKEAMLDLEKSGKQRYQYGVVIEGKGIARDGFDVFKDDRLIGKTTSGNFSPSLEKAIAVIIVSEKLNAGDLVDIQIRGTKVAAKVTSLPFLKK